MPASRVLGTLRRPPSSRTASKLLPISWITAYWRCPGFGPVLLGNLKRWRDQQERRFVFDPNKGVDQAAKNAVERQILTEKIDLERKLNEGLSKLTVSSHHILTRRRTLLAQAEQAAHDLAQAEADLRASSAISPIVPGKRAIVALGAISIGA